MVEECFAAVNYWFTTYLSVFTDILPSSPNKWIPRIRASQIFLSLTNFIEKSNNIYNINWAPYENIFYGKSNDTNLIP